MQDLILESDFDVPSLTHLSHTNVSSIIDCAQGSASHWNTY